ncbi:lipopolysaccharide biosynthesis protein RfbH [Synechococcus sp. W4D4]|uniref:lipopolysaccharide biosynthesis protein RfbH n=1 Tax=Synechococcus sp. W4D4 TaxID=3392294 RepID=UPI0039E7B513
MSPNSSSLEALKSHILELTAEYSRLAHSSNRAATDPLKPTWNKGDPIPYAARVFNEDEVKAAVSTTLDFWLTLGHEGTCFEGELSSFLGVRHSLLTNSGSSANLLAITALTSSKISQKKRLNKGDHVITVAAGFPTTVAPIIQNGAIPIFLDVNPKTANIDTTQLESAYCPGKTKAVVLAHGLGIPFNIYEILGFCRKYDLWLIEDNCDALGSTYSMPVDLANKLGVFNSSPGLKPQPGYITRWTGTWGDISTQSFYPPHHMTMGEGGAVNIVQSNLLKKVVESLRDWGRDCWCPSGVDNSCSKRFDWSLGQLPQGYDHKYTYSHLGYNLKPLDIQAAIGRIQLTRLPEFIAARRSNWDYLRKGLNSCSEFLSFALPTHATAWSPDAGFFWDDTGCTTDCSWFGFMITVKPDAPFTRTDFVRHLDTSGIGSRMFFGGNLVKQPAFVNLALQYPDSFIVPAALTSSDILMNSAVFIGTYPGLTSSMLDYEIEQIKSFVEAY